MLYIVGVLVVLGLVGAFLKALPRIAGVLAIMFVVILPILWWDTASCARPYGDVGDLFAGRVMGRYSELRFAKEPFLRKYNETDWNQLYDKWSSNFIKFRFMDIVEQHYPPEDEIFKLRGDIETEYPKALAFAESKVGHELTLHSEMFGTLKVQSFLKKYRNDYWTLRWANERLLRYQDSDEPFYICRNAEEVLKVDFVRLVKAFMEEKFPYPHKFSERDYRKYLRLAEQRTGQTLTRHKVW